MNFLTYLFKLMPGTIFYTVLAVFLFTDSIQLFIERLGDQNPLLGLLWELTFLIPTIVLFCLKKKSEGGSVIANRIFTVLVIIGVCVTMYVGISTDAISSVYTNLCTKCGSVTTVFLICMSVFAVIYLLYNKFIELRENRSVQ